jgi:hypothetical protein
MALVIEYPEGDVSVPIVLRLQGNGWLKTDQLAPVRGGGALYKNAAVAFNFMWSAAEKEGIDLNNWGTYRTYDRQLQLFLQRYSDTPTARQPEVRVKWGNKMWWLKEGYPPTAAPGTSDHGWGMAIDCNYYGDRLEWLKKHAPLFGYKWDVGDTSSKYWEPWHLIYCYGSGYTLWVSNLIRDIFGK